jgi:hypothetical protein
MHDMYVSAMGSLLDLTVAQRSGSSWEDRVDDLAIEYTGGESSSECTRYSTSLVEYDVGVLGIFLSFSIGSASEAGK